MISLFRRLETLLRGAALAGGVGFACAGSAHAALTNAYTFNDGTANDSVGTAHGTLFGTNGSFSGGQLVLANTGQGSGNPGAAGAYLDLPNGLISSAALGGGTNSVTVEMWVTVTQNRDWAAAFSAGINTGGENASGGGGDEPYIQIIPRTGDGGLGNDFRVTSNSYGGGEGFIDDTTDLTVNVKQHIVAIFNQSGGLPGTVSTYRNGVLVPAVPTEGLGGAIAANLDLTTFERANFTGGDVNVWLGRSQWGDQLISARYDEVRIHNSALSESEVTASFTTGPTPVALPVLRIDQATGVISFANPAGSSFNLKNYNITSASGQLNTAGWTSLDAGNTFDPDGDWTNSALTPTNIAEAVSGGSLDGGAVAGGTSKSIGSAWLRTPIAGDLQFTYELNGGATGSGIVEYLGSTPVRSDLNGDGVINAADWSTGFVPNHGQAFPGELAVAAYLKGDLDGDLDNDYNDFLLFKADYVAVNGAASFAALTAIPEPSALLLVALGGAGLAYFRRR